MKTDMKFAVLIDSDNIASKYINIILDEVTKEGTATYKRIYGDWTDTRLHQWKKVLLDSSIIPIQQYSYTVGKNATDSAMIIDAMDILYSGQVDGFCLVSSDSDFTRLASRLRESGKTVIGMGEKKTPKPFIAACEKFKYLDKLFYALNEKFEENKATQMSSSIKQSEEEKEEFKKTVVAIRSIINEASEEDGWIYAGHLGSLLVKRFPDFDVRNFGFSKMTPFLESIPNIETRRTEPNEKGVQLVYVKNIIKKRGRKKH